MPPRKDKTRRLRWGIASLASGAAFAAIAPPTDLYPLAWVGMAGLAGALADLDRDEARTARQGLVASGGRGLAFGVGANAVALRFVPEVITRFTPIHVSIAWLLLALLAMAQALGWGLAGVIRHALVRRGVPGWLAFPIGVYAGLFVPAIFPWTPAGGVTPWPAMVQLAEFIGERGVSFTMALTAGLVAHAVAIARASRSLRTARTALVFAALLPVATGAYGALRMRQIDAQRSRAPHAKVALLQPAIPALDRWDEDRAPLILEKLTTFTKSAERRGAELTVWPESAYPFAIPHSSRRSPIGARAVLQPGVRGPVLTGMTMTGGHGAAYNSAAVATSDGALSVPYDKRYLLWFGETVPLSNHIPWLRTAFARGTGLVAGDSNVIERAGPVRAGMLDCYEDTLPEAGRSAQGGGANLLVNVTNDAWFAGSAEGELHLRLAVLRAVETRRDLVRAVNMGPTSWVDAAGRVRVRYADTLPASVPVDPALLDGAPTPYVRWGDAPFALVLLGAAGASALRERRKRA